MAKVHEVNTVTTGRFVLEGKFSSLTRGVWICFHGYGVSAEEQIKSLDSICDEQVVIVCIEGFHRFYLDRAHSKVGASWMTKELRLKDIENNIRFCNQVFEQLLKLGLKPEHKLGIIGFSQGGQTMCRWIGQLDYSISVCLLWGSTLPEDVLLDFRSVKKINDSGLRFIVGERDKYISSDHVDIELDRLHDRGVSFDFHTFDGGHRLDDYTLRYFHARLLDDKTEY